jgi:hypothetical protein
MYKQLTLAANIAIIVVAVICRFGLIRNNTAARTGSEGQKPRPTARLGQEFPLAEPWASHRKTIVLALQVGCRYCSASASFYQELTGYALTHQISVVAVLPGPTRESAEYLQDLGLSIPVIQQVDFRDISVAGTPTLFLVDDKGFVLRVWQGQLQEEQQKSLLSLLG